MSTLLIVLLSAFGGIFLFALSFWWGMRLNVNYNANRHQGSVYFDEAIGVGLTCAFLFPIALSIVIIWDVIETNRGKFKKDPNKLKAIVRVPADRGVSANREEW